jgi:hypothetical protein
MADKQKDDLTSSPDFQAAVDLAVETQVQKLLPELMAKLVAVQTAASGPATPGDTNFVASLALALAELTSQGTGRVYVAPEIVERRRVAMEKMIDKLVELHAKRKAAATSEARERYLPVYRLRNKVFLPIPGQGETLIEPYYRDNTKIIQPQDIDWIGIPNLAMEPLNEAAKEVFTLYAESIGHQGGADAPDRLFFMTEGLEGVALRGGEGFLARDRAKQLGDPEGQDPEMPAAGLRRKDPAPKQKQQVWGSLTQPVEVV